MQAGADSFAQAKLHAPQTNHLVEAALTNQLHCSLKYHPEQTTISYELVNKFSHPIFFVP